MAQSFEGWWATLGPVTKFFLIAAIIVGFGFTNGFIPGDLIIIDFSSMFWKLHLWRPLTAVTFLGKVNFNWLFALAMLVIYVGRNEEDYPGNTADYVWVLTLLVAVLHVLGFFLGLLVLGDAFLMGLLWIWCRRHEDAQLTLYFFTFSAKIFPFVWVAFHMIMGSSVVLDIVGIVAGHVIYFLADVLPRTHNRTLIRTPRFMYRFFPRANLGVRGFDGTVNRGVNQDDVGHRWGGGRALGH